MNSAAFYIHNKKRKKNPQVIFELKDENTLVFRLKRIYNDTTFSRYKKVGRWQYEIKVADLQDVVDTCDKLGWEVVEFPKQVQQALDLNNSFEFNESFKETTLWKVMFPYQREGVEQVVKKYNGRALIGDEMGLGKTLQAISVYKYYNHKKLLIVCPAYLRYTWKNELEKWIPGTACTVILTGKDAIDTGVYPLIMSYELAAKWAKELKKLKLEMVVCDESHYLKSHKTKRTKALIQFGEVAKYKRILTGAPITKSPLDLYSQFLFLDSKILGHNSYWSFQGRYAVIKSVKMGAHSFNQVVGYRNLEEMKDKMDWCTYRTTKEEALDLPPKIYTTRQVDMTLEQSRHYDSLKETSVALLNSGEMVSAPEVMTRLLRLQQLLCGYLVTDNGEIQEVPNNRMNVLMETIEEMEGKVIIWSRFRHDIIKITEKLKQTYGSNTVVNYFGDTTMQDRQDAIEKFQNLEDDVKFFISNPQTGGMGITLHAATNVIYYSNDFNLESRKQSEDRAHRVGQHHPVLYVDLMCPNTVDVHIVKTLLNKNKLASITLGERVLEWLKT